MGMIATTDKGTSGPAAVSLDKFGKRNRKPQAAQHRKPQATEGRDAFVQQWAQRTVTYTAFGPIFPREPHDEGKGKSEALAAWTKARARKAELDKAVVRQTKTSPSSASSSVPSRTRRLGNDHDNHLYREERRSSAKAMWTGGRNQGRLRSD